MIARIPIVLTLLLPMTAALLGSTSESKAADVVCSGTIGGSTSAANIRGQVVVPDHASCTLSFVNVSQGITVGVGSNLVIAAYTEPSTIGGPIVADRCGNVMLQGNVTVAGDVAISSCTGSGQNGFQGPEVEIKGNFQCIGNRGGCLAWLGKVDGNVEVQGNHSALASDVSLVDVGGQLSCSGNAPVPTHLRGPSWGDKDTGQCNGFITKTTSIATPVSPAANCASLAALPASGFPVPNTVITSAVDTPAGSGLPERCIVNGYVNQRVSPVDGCTYQNGFQVQLPISANWNGRFMFQGGGGTEGSIPAATGSNSGVNAPSFGITNGYAVVSQDGGHENSQLAACGKTTLQFYLDPMATIGNGFQSIDVATLMAKYVINQYYGNGPTRSYWVGCSEGGRQGMVMSQNFPQYFDGIVAGDPVYDVQAVNLAEIWSMQQIVNVYQTTQPPLPPLPYVTEPAPQAPEPIPYAGFPAADQGLFERALLQACDGLDGVSDGVIDDIPACIKRFDPLTATYTSAGTTYPLQCPGAKNATCLSHDQLVAVMNINQGVRVSGKPVRAPAGAAAEDSVSNFVLGYQYDGGFFATTGSPTRNIGSAASPPGNEGQVAQLPYALISPANPAFDPLAFNFTTNMAMLRKATPKIDHSTSLDISRFVNYGHKIMWYHGLSDPGPPVTGTIKYYIAMANLHGGMDAAQKFSRLYPVPGMAHCSGGPTTDQFDMLTPLVQWVENGTAPGPVVGSGTNYTQARYQTDVVTSAPISAPTTRNRPICPYPQQARFTGSVHNAGGVRVATNPADLASASNYVCVQP